MFPKNLGIISRSTLVDLKNTTQRTFFEMCELLGLEEDVHYKFDRHEQRLKFDNGSEIIFTGLDDIAKIKGMEPGRFYIDEVDEVDPEVFKVFQRRLRNKYTDRRIGFITSNSE
jgi:phage terminase large subunit